MFLHNFKYTLKTLFRNKTLMFWTFAFPIIMATLFNMAFKDIMEDEKLKVIDIAIIDNYEFNDNVLYKETFKSLGDRDNKDRLFKIKYVDKKKASKLLEDDKIVGYLELNNNKPNLTYKTNGINQTILKYVVDEIEDTKKMTVFMSNGMNSRVDLILFNINNYLEKNEIKLNNTANDNLDYMIVEYYTLIAMTCLYAGTIGMVAIIRTLPYIKGNGKRLSISSSKKSSIVISSLFASYIMQMITLILLYVYTIYVLNIDYGDDLLYIILLSLVGSFAGVSLGLFVGTHFKTSENSKIGLMMAITMAGCFLAGMMGVGMKYIIDTRLTILNKINPANMITDGFYSLYYYTDYSRYWFNMTSLVIFTIILLLLSIRKIGRARYDSI